MKLLLDTNIVVDILTRRAGYRESLDVLRCCEAGRAEGIVSAITATDVMDILRKHIEPSEVREAVRVLLAIVDVVGVSKGDIRAALSSDMTDFEDAVQASCAMRARAELIVTRNGKDFVRSPVPAISPGDMLARLA